MLKEIDSLYAKSTLIFSEQEINLALDKMAEEITHKLADKNPIFLCVMNGGIIIMGHLMTRLNFHLQLDYVHATRYKDKMSGGDIEWLHKPKLDVKDRVVVIVDDILDEGITLSSIREELIQLGAREVQTVVLINKKRERPVAGLQKADFAALDMDDYFIFGYGLDYKGYLRNLAGIFKVNN